MTYDEQLAFESWWETQQQYTSEQKEMIQDIFSSGYQRGYECGYDIGRNDQ